LENARPHNSGQSIDFLQAAKARRTAQPADSPDLATSDFFLFGYLKEKLQAVHIPNRERLKSEIIWIFGENDPDLSISLFEDWIKRLEWVVQNRGSTSTIK
jgi:hypothetical protein